MRSRSRNKRQGPANIPDGRPGQGQQRLRSGPASFRFRGERPLGFSSMLMWHGLSSISHPSLAIGTSNMQTQQSRQPLAQQALAWRTPDRLTFLTIIENETDQSVASWTSRKLQLLHTTASDGPSASRKCVSCDVTRSNGRRLAPP
ncbi:hypothetical protein CSOJ01_10697 [Colletotrichum sojae]|uniref:Uncharacterized protein n=1 Tax=Colletotrichum sojae TaxID=2175907 RepID=A0A8H6J079_9PEZI|nr:hypothetical protein CSOJ01_10697 [Colletotrichum sojae]